MFEYLKFNVDSWTEGSLEVSISNKNGIISADGNVYSILSIFDDIEKRVLNERDSKTYIKKIEKLNIYSWSDTYSDNSVTDGSSLVIKYKENDKSEKLITCHNSYPDNFNKLLNIMKVITKYNPKKFF